MAAAILCFLKRPSDGLTCVKSLAIRLPDHSTLWFSCHSHLQSREQSSKLSRVVLESLWVCSWPNWALSKMSETELRAFLLDWPFNLSIYLSWDQVRPVFWLEWWKQGSERSDCSSEWATQSLGRVKTDLLATHWSYCGQDWPFWEMQLQLRTLKSHLDWK